MNIEHIEAFVYVNHYGSFNKASEVLYLSQPSVTSRIQTLERELDCRLFERQGKQIQLSDKGKQFLPYAQQILQTFQKGKQQLQARSNVPHELKIGATISVSNYLLPEILPLFKEQYPEINIKLITGTTDSLVAKLHNNEIDIGFVRKATHPTIQSFRFFDDPIRLYVYEGHPFLEKSNVAVEDLISQQFVFFECGSLDWLRVHRVFENLDYTPDIQYQIDNSETAKKLVLRKAGICFLPKLSVREEVTNKQLHQIDIPEVEGISLQTHLISLQGEHALFTDSLLQIGKSLAL